MSVLTPLRVRLPFGSEEEFVAQYGAHVGRDGFFLATRAPKEVGARLLFELVLTGGESVLRGEGMVVRSHLGERPGMTIRFLRLDAAGTDLVERIVAGRAAAETPHPPSWSAPGGRPETPSARAERPATSALPSAWAPPVARARIPPPAPPPEEPSQVEADDVESLPEPGAAAEDTGSASEPEAAADAATLISGDEPLEAEPRHLDEPLEAPLRSPEPPEPTPHPVVEGESAELGETSRFGTVAGPGPAAAVEQAPVVSPAAAVEAGPEASPPPEPPELVVTEFIAPRLPPPVDVHGAITPPAGTPAVPDLTRLAPLESPTPVEPTPVEPAPVESAPVESAPEVPFRLDPPVPADAPAETAEASFREVAEALAASPGPPSSVHDRPTRPIPLASTMEIPSGIEAREADAAFPPTPGAPPAARPPSRETPVANAVIGIDLGPEFVRMAWIREGRAEALALGPEGGPLDFRVRLVREPGAAPRVLPADASDPPLWVGAPLPFLGLRADSPLFRTVARRWPAPVVADDRGEAAFALEGGTVGATELLAALLRWLRHRAEELTGRHIARAVLPVPVSFTALQRERLLEAAERAGLEGLRLVQAPTAAAMAFAHGRGLARRRILVWRLGASAFDVAVLAASGDDLDMVAAAGDPSLGGMNFDEQIALTLDKVSRADPVLLRKRIGEAEALKRALDDAALDEAVLEGGVRLTRAELEARTSALVERGVLLAREVLRSASLGPDNLDELLLVGGASRLPHVRRLVEEAVGRPPRDDLDVGGAVAQGAAIIGNLLSPGGSKSASRTAVHEVLGVALEVVSPELGQVRVLERNTRLPAEKTLALVLGFGVPLEVQLFQGPGRAPDPRSFLGLLRAPGDRAGEWTLHLALDTDGILHASATNPSGKRQLLQLQTPSAPAAARGVLPTRRAGDTGAGGGHPGAPGGAAEALRPEVSRGPRGYGGGSRANRARNAAGERTASATASTSSAGLCPEAARASSTSSSGASAGSSFWRPARAMRTISSASAPSDLPSSESAQSPPLRFLVEGQVLLVGEAGEQGERGVERAVLVEQPPPQRQQGAGHRQRDRVGSSHFHHPLDPHLREEGGEMVGPVGEQRRLSLVTRLQQLAKGQLGGDVVPVPAKEEERGTQGPLDVGPVVEAPVQHAGEVAAAGGVHVGPDVAPVAHPSAGLSAHQRAVGVERHQQRGEARGGGDLAPAIDLVCPVERDLSGTGHQHHVQRQAAATGQRLPHHLVAALRHPGDVGGGPPGPVPQGRRVAARATPRHRSAPARGGGFPGARPGRW